MRCSLLALSTFIDSELAVEQTGELEAHLLACDRCRTAIGYLREESGRIGALARVHIPDDAVHEMFSQIGLIEEGDDLPDAPPQRDRTATVEAPPWFGAERGQALPWAPHREGYDAMSNSPPRELIGGRTRTVAVVEPPELLLWDEPPDQIDTEPRPLPPPVRVVLHEDPEPRAMRHPVPMHPEVPAIAEPQPPAVGVTGAQPPEIASGPPLQLPPHATGGPNAFQRMRDTMAVRFALWRGAGSHLESDVEIVRGAGAPTWNQRAHPRAWSDSPPVVVAPEPPAVEHPLPPPLVDPGQEATAVVAVEPALGAGVPGDGGPVDETPANEAPDIEIRDTDTAVAEDKLPPTAAQPQLADILGEVSTLAAPLEQTRTRKRRPAPTPLSDPEPVVNPVDASPAGPLAPVDELVGAGAFSAYQEPAAPAGPGRHLRRVWSQKPDRRTWDPTQPVTGRHVLPLGGPAVAAADRDRRLWVFGAITLVFMVVGLVIGRQVTQTGPLAAGVHRPSPTAHAAVPPPSTAPLPIATPVPTAVFPSAPTPQQLTKSTKIGTGSGGFSVADVRYGEHPNDFRLVFDLAFPNTVTGSPTTVVGYYGATTLYVEFSGVAGTAPIKAMPPGQIVVSVEPLPQARNTGRLIFKITLRKNAPYDAYYLSGARLIIDVT